MSLLPWTLALAFGGALAALAAGRRSAAAARWTALAAAAAILALAADAAAHFDPGAGGYELANIPWIPFLGVRFHLAADGISLVLVLLTALVATAGVLFAWNVGERTGEFFALYLALVGGVLGVFLSADALLFFVFYEIAIVPKYFLIAGWGSTNRSHGAMQLVLYSFAGSALVLAGLLWAGVAAGEPGFGIADLAIRTAALGPAQQIPMFALVFTGFAVLAGLVPFHTWAPTGHVAAPTAASMLLAGVVMKLGAYGCLRIALPLFPYAFAVLQPAILWLAAGGIVYAGLVALVQDDLKFVIGYSSISHMGWVLLGLAAGTRQAAAGAVLQVFSHGVIAGLLFAAVGRLVYDRTHTRRLKDLKALSIHRLLPFATVIFVLAGLASMGMPGFSGFPAELTILIGTWKTARLPALCAVIGIPIGVAFMLRAAQTAFFGCASKARSAGHGGPAPATATHPGNPAEPLAAGAPVFPPITLAEKAGAGLLLAATIAVGVDPDLLLRWITPALNSPLFQHVLAGGPR